MYEFLEETVRTNMTHSAKAVAPETTVGDLLRLFAIDDVDAYPVVSGGRLIGIASKADALKAFALKPDSVVPHYDDAMGTTIGELMTNHVMTVDPDTRLQRVLHLMGSHHFKSLPVVDSKNRLLGMIAREDVIRALARCNRRPSPPPQPLALVAPAVGYYAIA
jgi:CBS domain-containing protein